MDAHDRLSSRRLADYRLAAEMTAKDVDRLRKQLEHVRAETPEIPQAPFDQALFDFDDLQMQLYQANEYYNEQRRRFAANMTALGDIREWDYDAEFRERLAEAETTIRETLAQMESAE